MGVPPRSTARHTVGGPQCRRGGCLIHHRLDCWAPPGQGASMPRFSTHAVPKARLPTSLWTKPAVIVSHAAALHRTRATPGRPGPVPCLSSPSSLVKRSRCTGTVHQSGSTCHAPTLPLQPYPTQARRAPSCPPRFCLIQSPVPPYLLHRRLTRRLALFTTRLSHPRPNPTIQPQVAQGATYCTVYTASSDAYGAPASLDNNSPVPKPYLSVMIVPFPPREWH